MPDDDTPDDTPRPEGAEDPGREGVSPSVGASPEALVEPLPSDPTPPQGIPAAALEVPPAGTPAEAYARRARLAEDRLTEVLAAYRKLKTDNDAYRGRLTKNLERRYEQRRERLLLKFIDILDNLDRALGAAETTYTGEPMIEGLILVRTQLLQTLQDEGLERIPVLGLPYDPATSEGVETRAVDDPEHHHVVTKELMRGYRLNGRIARAARVVVGEHRPEATQTSETQAGEPTAVSSVEAAAVATAVATAGPPRGKASRRRAGDALPVEAPGPEKPEGGEPTLEEIIARAQAQEALFPDAFSPGDADETAEAVETSEAEETKTPRDDES